MGDPCILQSNLMFCTAIMMNSIVIIHRYYVKVMESKRFYIIERYNFYFWKLLFIILITVNHNTRLCRHHYRVVIRIFYNKHIKFKSLTIYWATVTITYLLKKNRHWFDLQKFLTDNIYASSPIKCHRLLSHTYQSTISTQRNRCI